MKEAGEDRCDDTVAARLVKPEYPRRDRPGLVAQVTAKGGAGP